MNRRGGMLILLVSGILLACQLQYIFPTAEPSPAPRATRTKTPKAEVSASPTAVAPLPGGPAPVIATAKENLRVRAAPSTSATQIGLLNKGDTAQISGRTAASDWWQIILPTDPGSRGWVFASLTAVSGPVQTIPIVPSGAIPPPVVPTPRPYP
ncbi:MAG: SH3 domain-containing protein [Chloroflexota bacterium]|nr:SH3 domain-containing protein [Chloroflexota bacterium]